MNASRELDRALYSHRSLCRHTIGPTNFMTLKQNVKELSKNLDLLRDVYHHIETQLTDTEIRIAYEFQHQHFVEVYSRAQSIIRESQVKMSNSIVAKLRLWSHTSFHTLRSLSHSGIGRQSLVSNNTADQEHDEITTIYSEADAIISAIEVCLHQIAQLLSPLHSVTDVFVRAMVELERSAHVTSLLISDKQHELYTRECDLGTMKELNRVECGCKGTIGIE